MNQQLRLIKWLFNSVIDQRCKVLKDRDWNHWTTIHVRDYVWLEEELSRPFRGLKRRRWWLFYPFANHAESPMAGKFSKWKTKILNWKGVKHSPYVTGKWCSVNSAFRRQQTPSTTEVTVTVSCACSPHVFHSLCHLHHRTGHLLGWTAVVWSTNLHPEGDGVG